jgi:hypothetical protein
MSCALLATGLLSAIVWLLLLNRNIKSTLYAPFNFFKIFKVCVFYILKIVKVFVFLLKSRVYSLIWRWVISDDVRGLWDIDSGGQDLAGSFWRVLVFRNRLGLQRLVLNN